MTATLSLVVPAFNEERRLPVLFEAIRTGLPDDVAAAGLQLLEVVVVDDGSTDATARLLGQTAALTPVLRPWTSGEGNRGKGRATACGVRVAQGDFTLLCDVDLAAPVREVHKLHARLRAGADIAVGSRALAPEDVSVPALRRVLSRGFNTTVRGLTGLGVRDTQCGFKLLRTRVARRLLARQLCQGYAFDVELLMRARRAGLRIDEVPVSYEHDGDSRLPVASASVGMARDVARLSWALRVRGSGRFRRRAGDDEPSPESEARA